jgi:two-component system, response regulator / RNA-binding antiterminator
LRAARTLHRPFTAGAVLTSLAIARAQILHEHRLRARIDKLDETLRSFRSVERANNVLMEKRKLDDEEAYHFKRRQAMNPPISIGSIGVVAAAVIDSHDILG